MAIRILENMALFHDIPHDMESFYWVLLWVALRHTEHSRGQKRCEEIFVYGDDKLAGHQKWQWIDCLMNVILPGVEYCPLVFVNSEPLTFLLEEFRLLVKDQYMRPSEDILTHDAVLALFDQALGLGGWSTQCDRIPCTLPDSDSQSDTEDDENHSAAHEDEPILTKRTGLYWSPRGL